MKLLHLIGILALVALAALGVVLALYQHKKGASGEVRLIGEMAEVEATLDPEGTVIVGGELWRAKSNDGSVIPARARVRVVGFEGHLVVVESYS